PLLGCRPTLGARRPCWRASAGPTRVQQEVAQKERPMIQIIEGLPDNVVGIVAKGRVTNEDCDKILKPLMETSLKRHDKVRLYYEIGCRFPGAAWEDLRIGLEHIPQWERVAVVTDVGWVRHTVNALRFLIASDVRVFTSFQAPEGRAWITAH